MRKALAAALVTLGAAGCASAPLSRVDLAAVEVAGTRLLEGCYTCLLEARDTFRRLAVGRARPVLVVRLFEAEVLVGLREREMAMDASEAFDRAEALMGELPATYPGVRYLDLARMVPPDAIGTPRVELDAIDRRSPRLTEIADSRSELETGEGSGPFRQYLSASLTCVASARRGLRDLPEPPDGAPLLVRYRFASCPGPQARGLESVVAVVPDFVEAEYLAARIPSLAVTSAYIARQRAAFTAARERFPRSPSVAYSLGAMHQTIGDCKTAIRHYEDTIAMVPLHEQAAMQRVICLGHIGQFVPAIEGATRIIEAEYPNFAEAYYWRAWNHYQRKDLVQARRDIDRAREVSVNIQVLILGGMVKFDQGNLDLAEADLREAIRMDRLAEQCGARWYYGLVGFAREDWPETASRFEAAGGCYRKAVETSRASLARMRTADVDETFRASQMAGFEAAIKEDTDQEQAAYLNAANGHARAGNLVAAREWLARIPADSVHALTAAALRKQIGG